MFAQLQAQLSHTMLFQSLAGSALLTMAQGFLLCASLIIAIGPQNLFILQQGLHRRHLFATALLCTLFDLVLIALGVGGVGAAIAANERVRILTTLGGTTFLLGYGVRSLRSAWYIQPTLAQAAQPLASLSLKGTILATLSFSFLNPAAYIDTILMIGTAGSRFPLDERVLFGAGAVMASCLWFFTLTYGSSRLAPLFRHPVAWRTLDLISGCIMVGLAGALSVTQSFWF